MGKYQTNNLFASENTAQQVCSHIIHVALESGADTEFDYLVPDDLWPIAVGQERERWI